LSTAEKVGSSGVRQLLRERVQRKTLYGVADYWDARADAREGLARSMWPSNAFNALWHERQQQVILRALGGVVGHRVADIGCGTGRMSRWLAESCGAREVVGIDFSAATVAAARDESAPLLAAGRVRYEQGDVLQGLDALHLGAFDDVLVVGCLSVACSERATLQLALENLSRLVRPGGRVLLLEPIHRSPLLKRVLDLGVEEWIACANRAGLVLDGTDRMGFVPVRLALSVRDLPLPAVAPLFRAGEALLDRAPWLGPVADYKLLLFRRPA
jgi:SAM-dependent methyltransferase